MVLCLSDSVVDFFCVSCWDENDWNCPSCHCLPLDKDVIGCEKCGQWSHNGCTLHIDINNGYTCFNCQTSDTNSLKETVLDQQSVLLEAAEETKLLQTKFLELTQVQKHSETMLTTLKKKNVETAAIFANRLKSQQTTYKVFSTAMKKKMSRVHSQTNVYQQEVAKLQQQHHQMTAAAKSTDIRHRTMAGEVRRLRKRGREHDDMVETMSRYVKRHRPVWSCTPPVGLNEVDRMLWNLYECKVCTHHGVQQYAANKVQSNVGNPVVWKSLAQTLSIVRHLYSKIAKKNPALQRKV